jgi:hypothetical protein
MLNGFIKLLRKDRFESDVAPPSEPASHILLYQQDRDSGTPR